MTRSEICGLYGDDIFNFVGDISKLFSTVAVLICCPHQQWVENLSLHILSGNCSDLLILDLLTGMRWWFTQYKIYFRSLPVLNLKVVNIFDLYSDKSFYTFQRTCIIKVKSNISCFLQMHSLDLKYVMKYVYDMNAQPGMFE